MDPVRQIGGEESFRFLSRIFVADLHVRRFRQIRELIRHGEAERVERLVRFERDRDLFVVRSVILIYIRVVGVDVEIRVLRVKAEILAGEAHDHNSFEDKNAVGTRAFEDFEKQANGFATVLPPCSVVKFVIR